MKLLDEEDLSAEINDHLYEGIVDNAGLSVSNTLRWDILFNNIRKPAEDNVAIIQRRILQDLIDRV